ncbi:MAG: hypothetical protein GX329_07990 [Tissierellia bacterium]|nr:hypothetical protein [Tissierellia bacterium]
MDTRALIGEIAAIYIKRNIEGTWEALGEGQLRPDFGLMDHIHSGKGDRQVAILPESAREELSSLKLKGICTERFHENITIRGLNPDRLGIGSRIVIGETIQEVTEVGKLCFPECNIMRRGEVCPLIGGVIFTRVETGGRIRTGDLVWSMQL